MTPDRIRAGLAWASQGLAGLPVLATREGSEALLDVMLVAAFADGEMSDVELSTVAREVATLRMLGAAKPEEFERELRASGLRIATEGPDRRLQSAARVLADPMSRLAAMRLAAVLVMCDDRVTPDEPAALASTADALRIDPLLLADIVSAAGRALQ